MIGLLEVKRFARLIQKPDKTQNQSQKETDQAPQLIQLSRDQNDAHERQAGEHDERQTRGPMMPKYQEANRLKKIKCLQNRLNPKRTI